MIKFIINILYILLSLIDNINYKYCQNKLLDNYKTIEDIEVNELLIQTDTGYKPITHLFVTKPFAQYKIKLENGYELTCADEHIVFDECFCELYVKDLFIGQHIQTDMGLQKIVSIDIDKTKISMCDVSVDDEKHRFYSNGILSHNSTTTAIYCLWVILFNTDKTGLILSKSGAAGKDLLSKIKDMYLNLPYHLKCGTMKWNQSEISFDNNSNISTESFSPTAGLGKTINFLILDEFAWCPPNDVELFYNNIIPTVTTISDSNVCIMSTQNGFNLFYKIWKNAIEHKSVYAPFKIDWYQVPQWNKVTKTWDKRTDKWKEEMIGILGSKEAFYYQYGTEFSASDKCLVSRECLSRIRDNTILFESITEEQLIELDLILQHKECFKIKPDYDVRKFKDGNHWYIILCDLAEGGGGDYTVFNILEILDKDTFEQIGYWRSNKVDLEHAALEFWLLAGQLFNNDKSIISIEWNTYGHLFYKMLFNLNEPSYDEESFWRNNVVPDGLDIYNIAKYKKTMDDDANKIYGKYIPGIKFTSSNKPYACSLLRMMFEKQNIIITDIVTSGELENFEDKNGNGSYKAAFGHDDIIMTLCQLPMIKETMKFKDMLEEYSLRNINNDSSSNSNEIDLYNVTYRNTVYNMFTPFDQIQNL